MTVYERFKGYYLYENRLLPNLYLFVKIGKTL